MSFSPGLRVWSEQASPGGGFFPRAASISSILEANPKLSDSHYEIPQADDLNKDGRDVSSVSTQVQKALKLATENNEMLVVCGSVFVMADARETELF